MVDTARDEYHFSDRKRATRALFDELAPRRAHWVKVNEYFYERDLAYLRFLVPPGARVLEIGCGNGQLLDSLRPSHGVGVDLSPAMIGVARGTFPDLEFITGDVEDPRTLASLAPSVFDYIILSDVVGLLDDCETALNNLHQVCHSDTRIIIAYYSHYWEPVLSIAERLNLKMPQMEQNWLSTEDIMGLLGLADFDPITREWRTLVPRRLFGIGTLVNRWLAPWPLLRRLCLRNYVVSRPLASQRAASSSTSVLIPCRNERGNIESAIARLPRFCEDLEIIFVEGGSRDGTLEEIHRVIAAYPEHDIKVIQQDGKGKGNAVRCGFAAARGEILMILDGDLTVPPEDLPKFYRALMTGKGEFINGSRLVYPMQADAMRFLNEVANRVFSILFSWLLNQRYTDTLCGTKVLRKKNYEQIVANRSYFGDFDPFGDFDLIFGAAKLSLKTIEVPVRYRARTYGETQISRFRHGLLLIRMVGFAFLKLKAL